VRPYNEETDFWPVAELQVGGSAKRSRGTAVLLSPCTHSRGSLALPSSYPILPLLPLTIANQTSTQPATAQARCFHDKIPFAPLDGLAFTVFKAEVVDGLKSKARCVDPATYAMLVVEAAADGAEGGGEGGGVDQEQQASISGSNSGGGGSDSQQQQQKWQYQSTAAPSKPARSSVIGIVELGLQEEGENVRALQQSGILALGGSSSRRNSSSSSSSSSSSRAGSRAAKPPSSSFGDGEPACVYLSSMAVSPAARRTGAARAMLLAAQWQAALWGQRHIALHVYADNAPAVRLYSSAGWQSVGRDPDWRKWLGGKVRSFMVKALPSADELVEAGGAAPEAVVRQLQRSRERRGQPQQEGEGGQQQRQGQQQGPEGMAEEVAPAA